MSGVVLCASNIFVVASSVLFGAEGVTVTYVNQKVEHTETYMFHEVFEFPEFQVSLYTPRDATSPCTLLLPPPFNNCLKRGTTLFFCLSPDATWVDHFVPTWNECCTLSLTWQHNRQKKAADPLQKLGLPPKLTEFLCEQVSAFGIDVPMGSDYSDEEAVQEEKDSSSSGDSVTSEESEDYYSSAEDLEEDQEDLEEEEEVEEEPEPEELLDDD